MLLSEYFLPIIKEKPSEAKIISHDLMLRCGIVRMHSAGIYNWLPIGVKILNNIKKIIRKNLDEIGCLEILMSCIQSSDLWEESGRISTYGSEMLKIYDRHNHELIFGPTNEEVLTDIIRSNIKSYRELPKILYQIQSKFRDEIRPRFGTIRAREFIMKDAYSIDISKEAALLTYNKIFLAYMKIFHEIGLEVIPASANSGEIGGDMSHEFHVLTNNGESLIYYHKDFEELKHDPINNFDKIKNLYAAADEKHASNPTNIKPHDKDVIVKTAIEVGHIFNFGDKYSKSLKALVADENNKEIYPNMGAYGIGVSRIPAAIIESNHDEKGIIWPKNIAPFHVSLINLSDKDQNSKELSSKIYFALKQSGFEVLFDDTKRSPGQKLIIADRLGMPYQVIIGTKSLKENFIEVKNRKTHEVTKLNASNINSLVQNIINIVNQV